jgi:hypothetical protein
MAKGKKGGKGGKDNLKLEFQLLKDEELRKKLMEGIKEKQKVWAKVMDTGDANS